VIVGSTTHNYSRLKNNEKEGEGIRRLRWTADFICGVLKGLKIMKEEFSRKD